MRLYIGNISYETTEQDLTDYFQRAGYKAEEAHVIRDRESGKSRGFGFVTLGGTEEDGRNAIDALNSKEFMGRRLNINEAKEKSQTSGGRRHGNGSRGHDGNSRGGRGRGGYDGNSGGGDNW